MSKAGRPVKDTVEYFPHFVNQGKTMFILEQKYGNDGYAFWFKLLEMLASTEGHIYDCDNESDWLFLQAKTHLNDETMSSMLDTLCNLGAIDKELWQEKKIWCQKLVNNLQPVYANRRRNIPEKPISTSRNHATEELLQVETIAEDGFYEESAAVSKVKYSKVKERYIPEKKKRSRATASQLVIDVISHLNKTANTAYKPNTQATIELINAREKEGYTLDDFIMVINAKCSEWLYDDQHNKYLRPETLFGNKFEGYVNTARLGKHLTQSTLFPTNGEPKKDEPMKPQKVNYQSRE